MGLKILLIVPLNRFLSLAAVILVAIMHCMFPFYLGLHHVAKVPRRDAAECTAIVIAAGITAVPGYDPIPAIQVSP